MKLSLASYHQKFKSVSLVFDLLRRAVQEMGSAAIRQFMQESREPGEANIAKMLSLLADDPGHTETIQLIKRHHKRKMSAELPVAPTLKWAEYKGHAQLGLNASELVLRVALFESVMKRIHQHVLMAEPEIMARVKPNRPVVLKDLFRSGFERFKHDELLRQVREADRLRTKERAKFFSRRLKLPWGDEVSVSQLAELVELRHEIVHGSLDQPVTDNKIEDARRLFLAIPRDCFRKASDLYPTQFGI